MKDRGFMTKLMAMVFIYILMEQFMKVSGWVIYSMAEDAKDGQIVQDFKENTEMERKMGEADMTG
jgi:hypothetical protein